MILGCMSSSLPFVTYEYPILENEKGLIEDGETKLIIFNSSNPVSFRDTGTINIYLNGKSAAQLEIYEYVELIVPSGKYNLELLHHDLFPFNSSHSIELTTKEVYLEVYATILSNKARIVTGFPENIANKLTSAF